MMPLDDVIASMKESGCLNCSCESAIFDENGKEVSIKGWFCTPAPNNMTLEVIATDYEGEVVWKKLCETGKTCSIPFTSESGFTCY